MVYIVEAKAAKRQVVKRQVTELHEQYLHKAAGSRLIDDKPHPDLRIVVVIPCHNEPDLIGALEHLANCKPPLCHAEVIVVVNGSANNLPAVHQQNQRTLDQAADWLAKQNNRWLPIHLLNFTNMPSKHAGVGQARKIGMDEALRRLADIGHAEDGLIVCYDADCRCSNNYFTGIESHFALHKDTPGCSIHFEHPLDAKEWTILGFGNNAAEQKVFDGITSYELHLRYHVQAQKFIGFPYGFHTIGSAMAVRAWAYVKQGGMNRRQAGEDFYFLQKISWLGPLTELDNITVYPSPRLSDRVPFGTGKAVGDYLANCNQLTTYPLQAYREVQWLLNQATVMWEKGKTDDKKPKALTLFLGKDFCSIVLPELRENSGNFTAFRKRFLRWFNAFRLMKFLNFARDQVYSPTVVEVAAKGLLKSMKHPLPNQSSTVALLRQFRRLEKEKLSGDGLWQ